eukprot:gene3874-4833_t
MNNKGMFATLHFAAYALTRSFDWNRKFILDDKNFLFADDWNDLFLPVTDCPIPTPFDLPQSPSSGGKGNDGIYKSVSKETQILNTLDGVNEYDDKTRISIISNNFRVYIYFIPSNVIPKDWFKTFLQFRSYIMNWLIRPNYNTRKNIEKVKYQLWGGLKTPKCISMHIRNGDKIKETSLYYFDQYMETLIDFTDNGTLINDVFLMTDNDTIIKNRDKYLDRYPQFKFHYLSDVERSENSIAFTRLVELKYYSNQTKSKFGLDLLTETIIASECDFFIGTLTSNIGRAIIELMISNPINDPYYLEINWRTVDNSLWFADP